MGTADIIIVGLHRGHFLYIYLPCHQRQPRLLFLRRCQLPPV
jgi:hypothetical protein